MHQFLCGDLTSYTIVESLIDHFTTETSYHCIIILALFCNKGAADGMGGAGIKST